MAYSKHLNSIIASILGKHRKYPFAGTLALILSIVLIELGFFALTFIIDLKTLDSRDYLVIQKSGGILSTIPGFSKKELENIESNPAVIKAFPVSRISGEVFASVQFGSSSFGTLLFIESVSREAVPEFKEKKQDHLEVIVGQSFIFLYNTTFAPAMGLPQVDETMLSLVPIELEFRGPGRTMTVAARIIGVTDKIDTVLIAPEWLEMINKEVYGKTPESSKALLKVVDKNSNSLKSLIKEGAYQTLGQSFSNSVITELVQKGFVFIFVMGVVLLLSSISVFVSQSRIIQFRSEKDRLLLQRYRVPQGRIRALLFLPLHGAVYLSLCIGLVTNLTIFLIIQKYFNPSIGLVVSSIFLLGIWILFRSRIDKKAA